MDNTALFFQIFNLSHQNPLIAKAAIFGAEYLIFLTIILVFLLVIKAGPREKKSIFLIILGLLISEIIIQIIRIFYLEPRPFISHPITTLIKHSAEASFPSTHTTIMAVFAWAYTFYRSKYASLFLTLMLIVGFSRIVVGVHYPIDILGGIIVGFISVFIAWQIKNYLKQKLTKF